MDPIRLQKQLRENTLDLQDCFKDLKKWGDEMKRKEETLKSEAPVKETVVPIPRNKTIKSDKENELKPNIGLTTNPKKAVPKDFTYWEKFDVDAECEKVDKEKSSDEDDLSDISDEFDEEENLHLANEEKEKGNKFVKLGRYEDAIKCYSNSIEAYARDPVYFGNRALCYLKLQQYKSAEADCTSAIQLDDSYVKAYHRRALARQALKQHKEAAVDLEMVLKLEPNNKESKDLLEKVKKEIRPDDNEEYQRPVSKFTLSRQKDTRGPHVIQEERDFAEPIKDIIIEHKNPSPSAVFAKRPKTTTNMEPVQPQTSQTPPVVTSRKEPEISWPAGRAVKLIPTIIKNAQQRSPVPLKRIQVLDVDLSTQLSLHEKPSNSLPQPTSTSDPKKVPIEEFKMIERKQPEPIVKRVPRHPSEFRSAMSALPDDDAKFSFLRQIQPTQLAALFDLSLGSSSFSEIVDIFAEQFVSRNEPVFEYLEAIAKSKQFSWIVILTSSKDKKALEKLKQYMLTDARCSVDSVNSLMQKFGI